MGAAIRNDTDCILSGIIVYIITATLQNYFGCAHGISDAEVNLCINCTVCVKVASPALRVLDPDLC